VCRHVAYVGEPVTLAELLITPEQSLRRQSTAPRFQYVGRDNVDGFGVGWYESAAASEPRRYRTTCPMGTDDAFGRRAERMSATAVLAAVRRATPGSAVDERGNAPFADGPWLFSLNGAVDAYREGVEEELRSRLTPRRAAGIEGDTDSETLFALGLDRLDAGSTPGEALAHLDGSVGVGATSRLNLLLSDGHRIAATARGNSLFVRAGPARVVVASEPYDHDPAWQQVPDGSLVEADLSGASVRAL
jgi:gamma-glutamyl hercynylcysteine S-oxide hydrolase